MTRNPHIPEQCARPATQNDTQTESLADTQQSAVQEQDRLLDLATAHLSDYDTACVFISGRRGRGKSALLARIATWLAEQEIAFSAIAKHDSALRTFKKHYNGDDDPMAGSSQSRVSPDHILLVDEASNLSLKDLNAYADNHRKLVLCATVEGYENAGRAFSIRFAEQLKETNRTLLHLQPESPWRWRSGDRLEKLMNDLLLTHQVEREQSINEQLQVARLSTDTAQCRRVDQHELVDNEDLLYQIHDLLARNHYQSSVKDLQHLLDGASLQVWVQQIHQQVVGALVLEIEGEIDPSLHSAIINRKRRLPHQLLPQLLAQQCSNQAVLNKRFARIIRIAVASDFRRKRLASSLLRRVEQELVSDRIPINAIGASFANDAVSLAFWHSNGYQRFHQGFKINPRTGTTSTAVIKAWDKLIISSVSELTTRD